MGATATASDETTTVGVVGGGQMGAGIAEVAARAGLDVIVREVDAEVARAARERIAASLGRAAKKGKISEEDADAAMARIVCTDDWAALADRQVLIEAIIENAHLKSETFARLDEVVRADDAVLASNTSSIPISQIASATERPEAVIGMHFFNPVPVLALVELVPSLRTSEATRDRAHRFVIDELGKQPIWCTDRAGFVVNALLIPYLLSAIRMYEAGVATAEDIDTGMVQGCAHPMGPLRLTDLIGLDTTKAVADSLYEEFKEAHYSAPPVLSRMVEAGMLGRKAGRGFYTYD